ncbi:uncharacterized protein LOC123534279 [Mercenaria mercenaria]|uniref:uncharacterized protein LOC123534279 n=1 Tax=Mercenaria mercenaria TaxID=6596 RepID=UPI00234F667F|nr:uncharacterized protein LOC123534279 [Mercenaria mercenaria]
MIRIIRCKCDSVFGLLLDLCKNTAMTSSDESENHAKKERNWEQARHGLKYMRKGIQPFVNDVIKEEHQKILKAIQYTIGTNNACNSCSLSTLRPNHSKTHGRCPLNHKHCNCLLAAGKTINCPKGACGIVYERLITLHRFQSPNWKNVNPKTWCVDAWEIGKCFISTHGYDETRSIADIDTSGLLQVIINNLAFQSHLDCTIDPPEDTFSLIRKARGDLFHSAEHEIEQKTKETYLNLMISALKDKKELCNRLEAQEAAKEIEKLKTDENKDYCSSKKDLQEHLIQMYLKYYGRVSVHPLISSQDKGIDEMYVQPDLVALPVSPGTFHQEKTVTGYHDLFVTGNDMFKNIYLSGDAGIGKSAFCDEMVIRWCHIKSKAALQPSPDESVLLQFDFVFLIRLNISKSENHVHDMVKTQLVQDPFYQTSLDHILRNESSKCLILMDGLDEWCPDSPGLHLPMVDRMKDYVILTTSRPWKLDILKIKPPEMDRHIKLLGLSSRSSELFIDRIVTRLNLIYKQEKKSQSFSAALTASGLDYLSNNPILLQQLLCLWHSGKTFGNSQCDLYSKMIEFLLEFSEARSRHDLSFQTSTISSSPRTESLPTCLDNIMVCRQFRSVIESLAKVAFVTLVNGKKDMFERVFLKNCGLSENDIDNCLKIGLLTQCLFLSPIAQKDRSSVTFIHKTFQEFFAAIHLTMNSNQSLYDTSFRSLDEVFEMSKVLVFSSGMSEKDALSSSSLIQRKAEENEHLQNYRKHISCRLCEDENDGFGCVLVNCVQSTVFSCAEEYEKSGRNNISFNLVDILIDSDTDQNVLYRLNINCLKSVTILNFDGAARYVIDNSRGLQKITIQGVSATSDMLLASHICHMIKNSVSSLKSLLIDIDLFYFVPFGADSSSFDVHMNYFLFVLKLLASYGHELKTLKLYSGKKQLFQNQDIGQILNALADCWYLKELYVDCLISRTTNQLLSVAPALCLDLTRNINLEIFDFDQVSVKDIRIENNILHTFKFHRLPKLDSFHFLQRMLNSTWLTVLHLHFSESCSKVGIHLSNVVPTLKALRHISLWNIDFGANPLIFSEELQNLQHIELGEVRLSKECFDNLIDSLPLTQHELKVNLQSVIISKFENDLYIRQRLSERKHKGTVKVNVYSQGDFYTRII